MHTLLLALEAVAWWLVLVWAAPLVPVLSFTTLLPLSAYPIGISLGILLAMGVMWRSERHLAVIGWVEGTRLAFRQTLAVTCAVFTVAVGFKDPGISRVFLAIYLPTLAIWLVILNRYQPGWLVRRLYAGGSRQPTLILGDATLFPDLAKWLAIRERFGFTPIGVVSYHGQSPQIPGLNVLGDFAELKAVIARTGARQVLMLSLPRNPDDAEHLARVCAGCGCRLLIHNNLTFQLSYPLRVLMQDGYSFLAFQDEPLEDPLNRGLKRAVDVLVALPVTLFLLPPMIAIVWFAQRRQSPGPVFYRQVRSGRAGRTFEILKFRTMHDPSSTDVPQTARDDPRVFPFGRFLRRTSLDELPQFLNVLRGEMSVVGPRPHFVRHDAMFAETVNEYRVRFFVKPGITGLAQSRGLRGGLHTAESVHQRLQLDLLYIHNWSVWLDVAIIARTFRQIFVPPADAR